MPEHLFIAGAQRSGTSWLYRMLNQHPDITMAAPMRPEPKYFLQSEVNIDRYHKTYFPDAATRWFGEKSTSYIEHPAAARRIAETLPGAVVIFLLRDPVERAISNYRFSVENGLETLPIQQAMERGSTHARDSHSTHEISVSPFDYVERGQYVHFLDYWSQHFPVDQLKILVSEETVGFSDAVRKLFSWLQLPNNIPLHGVSESVNSSREPTTVPPKLRSELRKKFAASNRDLSYRYGVDVSAWQ